MKKNIEVGGTTPSSVAIEAPVQSAPNLERFINSLRFHEFAPGQADLATTDLQRAVYEQITNILTLIQGYALMGDLTVSQPRWEYLKRLAVQWLEDIHVDKEAPEHAQFERTVQSVESKLIELADKS